MILRLPLTFLLFAAAAPALAVAAASGPAAATQKQCVDALTPEGKQMFTAAAKDFKPGSDIRATIRSAVTPLVMSGALGLAAAQANGAAVGQCLALIK